MKHLLSWLNHKLWNLKAGQYSLTSQSVLVIRIGKVPITGCFQVKKGLSAGPYDFKSTHVLTSSRQ